MDWKAIKVPDGSKLFKIHRYNYLHQGINFLFEINELGDNMWIGHGEHATDQSSVIPTVNGATLEDCLNKLISLVNKRGP
ncbi:MAG: hypothetical protein NTX25_02655 [Proteobacteria bacterium]|nr:hypothetical protein [Pseudomonadota bacterium]